MSEKEFRAWDNERQNYRYSFTLTNDGIVREMDSTGGIIHNVDCIVEQWTGLLDKNGVKIFEGDILRHPSRDTCYIGFSPCDCGLRAIYSISNGNIAMQVGENGQAVVVGNIHENPELLEAVK